MKTTNFLAYLFLFGAAVAQSPHFVGQPSASIDNSGVLTVSFKEAGLGAGQTIDYRLDADFQAIYQCCNKGGKHPHAGNKEKTTGSASGFGTLNSGKNGNIQGRISLDSGPSPGTFTCPPGQSLLLTSVKYTEIVLTDTNNLVSVQVGDEAFSPQTC